MSGWIVGGALTLLPAVSAATVPTRLVYSRTQATQDCPDEPALAAAVAARLGYEPFSPWGDQTILATIVRQGGELVGQAQLIDHDGIAQGNREVRVAGSSCDALILALALAISITLDPLHVASDPDAAVDEGHASEASREDTDAPANASDPVPSLPVVARAPEQRRSDRGPSVTWHVDAGAMGTLAVTPQVSFGARLGVGARRGRWSLGLEGWATAPSAQEEPDGSEVRISVISGSVAPCYALVTKLALCAVGSLGSMFAEGRGIEDPRTDQTLYATVGGRAQLLLPLGSAFEFVASVDVALALNRPQFQLDGADAWRPPPVVALLGVGASARFF